LGLTLREEFKGRRLKGTAIELSNENQTGATQVTAGNFLGITYPTSDVLAAIEGVGPDRGQPVVLVGERGTGKSHLLGVLYHALNQPEVLQAWLSQWSLTLGNSKLKDIPLRKPKTFVISESLHRQNYKFLWDLIFDKHPHGAYIRGKSRVTRDFVEARPFAPHLMTLLEDQVLVATQAQETRDLIRILADVFKSRSESAPVITAADFGLDNDKSGIAAPLDSVSNQHRATLREKAQRHLSAVIDALNIHQDGARYVFREEENPQAKLMANARNDKIFGDTPDKLNDRLQLAREVRYVIGGAENSPQVFRVVVFGPNWMSTPWDGVDETDHPSAWDDRIPLLVLPEPPDKVNPRLGTWLGERLQTRRNAVRFLLPREGSLNLFCDRDLLILARAVVLADKWKANNAEFGALQRKYQRKLRDILKRRFEKDKKVFRLISPLDLARTWQGKHRHGMTSDYDQAAFLIGACFENSGINATETLSNDNFKPHAALESLLGWFALRGGTQETKNAASRAQTILRAWRAKHTTNAQQMSLFFDDQAG